jgi:nitrogen regulatory protein PII
MQLDNMQALLILIVPIKLEALIVDKLLAHEAISGFTSSAVSGHGSFKSSQLSLVEQVTGRQSRMQFMLHAELAVLQNLLEVLKKDYANADLHYILQPVLAAQSL